ncbi:hypothetical protein PCA31118_00023 [Pandoraea captiosa]|uniref:Uncharacterized protein n=1 Tax=Pandoraea captiosa TaxID=2508302 RepID=A0A5E4ZEK5_9BURK|nr:hypothetical protein [Pandoraea captiosa]VVE59811.1 hypothetical protein PCA31118_00023 [Pandoraea captiosa]
MTDKTNVISGTKAPESEELALLRKIDSNVDELRAGIKDAQRLAARNGAVAGAIAGAASGGIVALGIAFARAKLGI